MNSSTRPLICACFHIYLLYNCSAFCCCCCCWCCLNRGKIDEKEGICLKHELDHQITKITFYVFQPLSLFLLPIFSYSFHFSYFVVNLVKNWTGLGIVNAKALKINSVTNRQKILFFTRPIVGSTEKKIFQQKVSWIFFESSWNRSSVGIHGLGFVSMILLQFNRANPFANLIHYDLCILFIGIMPRVLLA